MTILWLLVWLINETPQVIFNPPNNWLIGLGICLAIDLLRLDRGS